ncbi:hypothetical protein FA15DRAFT_657000 [Coprinopsis marcescibilis]|uniref:Uncharacterized protein n=1 Tax=Coprinopsis marcescibilis TaxID=230819 RepID=A0A5C3KRJ7_COPMA|nr:hypothetical protein FA15DRAFT_657000 [Coprinopsis marcescibilis]
MFWLLSTVDEVGGGNIGGNEVDADAGFAQEDQSEGYPVKRQGVGILRILYGSISRRQVDSQTLEVLGRKVAAHEARNARADYGSQSQGRGFESQEQHNPFIVPITAVIAVLGHNKPHLWALINIAKIKSRLFTVWDLSEPSLLLGLAYQL